ncbi:hypothetical protein EDF56_11718 [Novosphingobium sp. PhB165]|uniref:hypothetical protein n=1 Tax=Novosphingobium sp. PhB165 TaxID=2485105 RepID=UPI00104A5A32|nr:hypothetical protein [Novosphingobium sp. PhB165]TCM12854.1 hypothetical protein EDF56_11718 [Novosphingobium sp. PhB165]
MNDRVAARVLVKGGELLLGPSDRDCTLSVQDLSFVIAFAPAEGEPKISWQQSGPTGLSLLVRGDTTSALGTMFWLNNVGTLNGQTLNLTLLVRGIGQDLNFHGKSVAFNFTLGANG